MKKIWAKIVSLAVMTTMLFTLAACGNDREGKLIMATNAQFPPYEYYENNEIVGIDAEIAAAIADYLGLELVIEDTEFGSILGGVQSGKYDIGMAGMTVTDERLQSVNFSTSYATGIQSIIVTEDSAIDSIDTLIAGDYIVGTQDATTGDIYMRDEIGDDRVSSFYSAGEAVLALQTGRIDCVVIDNQPALSFVAANEGLMILETPYAVEEYAIAIAKDNEELLADINEALAALTADGTIDEIISRYIPA